MAPSSAKQSRRIADAHGTLTADSLPYTSPLMSTIGSNSVAVFVLPQFNAFDLSAALQTLEEVDRGTASGRAMLLSQKGGLLASVDEVIRVPTEKMSPHHYPEHLVLIGGESSRLNDLSQVSDWLWATHVRGGRIYAVASAVFWVAALDLLDGARAAVHWTLIPEFRRGFPEIPLSGRTVESHGRIFTSVGGLGTLDLMLTVIARRHGSHVAKLVACRLALGDRLGRNASQWQIIQRQVRNRVPPLSSVIDLINSHPGPVSRSDICKASGLGTRRLERLCKHHLGVTPHELIRKSQLSRARDLICCSTMPISRIAAQVGFSSHSQFSKRYKQEFGERPTSSRFFNSHAETL